jgi:uncharacterized membrane protein
VRSLYFNIFSASFLITFLSLEIATSINMHVPFFVVLDYNVWLVVVVFVVVVVLKHEHADNSHLCFSLE